MPLIGTTGAASAKGFGFFAGPTGAPSFLGRLSSPNSIYQNNPPASAADTESNVIFVTGRYIFKYAASGAVIWGYIFSTSVELFGVVTDSSNNIYVVGRSNNDGFIAQLNSSGAIQWQKTQNPGTSTAGYARNMRWRSVLIDSSGNVNVVGTYNDNVAYTFCGCEGPITIPYDNGFIATAKYNSSGVFQWGRKFGLTSLAVGPSLAGFGVSLDGSGNIYASGSAENTSGNKTMPVLKYNSSGTQQWGYMYRNDGGTTTQDQGKIVTDSSGNSYVISTAIYGPASLFKIDTSGTLQWGKSFVPNMYGIAIDPSGTDIYVAGRVTLGSPYFEQAMLAKISSAGNIQFVRSLGTTDSAGVAEDARCLALSPDSNMVFAGPTGSGPISGLSGKLKTTGAGLGTYTVQSRSYVYATNASTLTAQTYTRYAATATYGSTSSDTALVVTEATSAFTLTSQAQTYASTVVA